jgi:hypothetical protein
MWKMDGTRTALLAFRVAWSKLALGTANLQKYRM